MNNKQGPIDLGIEIGEKIVQSTDKVITAIKVDELLGDIKPLTDEELQKKKKEEEKMKAGLKGNDLESQIKRLREIESRKQTKEKEMEEKKKHDQEVSKEEETIEIPTNPHKMKRKRGSAFIPADKKSQTVEFAKKPD